MPSAALVRRLEPAVRSATWPLTKNPILRPGADEHESPLQISHSPPSNMPAPTPAQFTNPIKPAQDPFENELDTHPEDHFLSPVQMYEYEDWADDSDDDADEVEWDAGITDFALFHNERSRAQERHEHVPDRWGGLVASQASALQRAVQRHRADSDPKHRSWTPLLDDVPQLTPDNSPDLKGLFDIHTHCRRQGPTSPNNNMNVPNLKVTPPDEDLDEGGEDSNDDYDEDSDEDDMPISYLVQRARERREAARKMERPGLRFSRTMSGKVHVWRRPSYQIYSVNEDAEAERKAERAGRADDH